MNQDMCEIQPLTIEEALALKHFAPLLINGELQDLDREFGPFPIIKVTLHLGAQHFAYWQDILKRRKNRRGEVGLVIENDRGGLLLHSKHHYPGQVYRFPTGGIHFGEPVLSALHREIEEETGLEPVSLRLLVILYYIFRNQDEKIPFVSYFFHVQVANAEPCVQDLEENISSFTWIEPAQLQKVVAALRALPADWIDWGVMRAIPHEIVAEMLSQQ